MKFWFKLSAAAALAASLVAVAPITVAQPDPAGDMPPGIAEMLTPDPILPVDPASLTTGQAKFDRFLVLASLSKLLKYQSVSDDGAGTLVGHGVYIDLSTVPDSPFKTVPLGDMTVTNLDIADVYVRNYRLELSGAAIDTAELRAFVMSSPAFGPPVDPNAPPPPAPDPNAPFDPNAPPPPPDDRMEALQGIAFVEGLGYTHVAVRIFASQTMDSSTGDLRAEFGLEFAEAFGFGGDVLVGGITDSNIRDMVAIMQQMYSGGAISGTSPLSAELEAKFKDPNGPFASVTFKSYALTFRNLGLLDRLKPMLDPLRVEFTGAGPNDPIPEAKFEEIILDATTSLELPREKVEGPIREALAFFMNPTQITLRIRTEPPVSVGEFMSAVQAAEAGAPPTDPSAPQTADDAALEQFKNRVIIEVTR